MRKKRSFMLLCMGLLFLPVNRGLTADYVAREIEPWWQTGAPEARAKQRLGDIKPESWTATEKAHRTICVAPIAGQDTNSAILILDGFAAADLYHFVPDPDKFKGSLYFTYEVLEPAPVMLTSAGGSAFWDFMNQTTDRQTVLNTDERWDVRKKGVFGVEARIKGWTSYVGAPLTKGVFVLTGRGTFNMVNPDTGAYIGNCNHRNYGPKYRRLALNSVEKIGNDLAFTAADLTRYEIRLENIVSDWGKSGYVGVVLTVKDAKGEIFDLPGAEVTARLTSGSDHESMIIRLMPRSGMYDFPALELRHHFYGAYPTNFFDIKEIQVNARLWVQGPDGVIREEQVDKSIQRDAVKPAAFEQWAHLERRKDLRAPDGKLMETRIMYVHSGFLPWWKSAEHVRKTVEAAAETGVNIISPNIYYHGQSSVRSTIMPENPDLPKDLDSFAMLIEESRKANILVLPHLSCMGGSAGTRPRGDTITSLHPEWAVMDKNNRLVTNVPPNVMTVADVHRPEFRAHLTAYLADIARRYEVAGFGLDYIRTMAPCFCGKCTAEYHAKTGRDLRQDANSGYPLPLSYKDWQAEAVGALVKDVRIALKAVNPNLKLTAWADIDDQGHQGRRPDIWLNNGWLDVFEYPAQGCTAEYSLERWRQIARRVNRPECVWPNFGTEHSVVNLTPESEKQSVVIEKGPTGEPFPKNHIRGLRGTFIQAPYETMRDRAKCYGFSIYHLGSTTPETRREIKTLLFPEPAVPWWPERSP